MKNYSLKKRTPSRSTLALMPVMKNSLGQYVLKRTWQGFNRSYEDMDPTQGSNSSKQESEKATSLHIHSSLLHHISPNEPGETRVFNLLPYILFLTETCSNASPTRTLVCALSVQL
ncbi:hypothetical protein AVEN_47606-1 [Araneus ventricosus]|uniref:Uncharacterized protein n=1 Tax=Araneus ventricosus TaxID=182803 RepID=A0A4Y2P2Q1_ARAVE|nr:hypothetical protein AVEN_47606-1 [Araneus ventricosus]